MASVKVSNISNITSTVQTGSILIEAQASEQSGNPTQAIQLYSKVIEAQSKDGTACYLFYLGPNHSFVM